MDNAQQQEVSRFYTAARRFHKLLGKLPDGTRIPGGPYTIIQGVALIVMLAVTLLTRGHLWTFGSFLIDVPLALVISGGVAYFVGRIPTRNRNLVTVGTSTAHAIASPAAGRRNGKKVTVRPRHRVGGDVLIDWGGSEPITPAAPIPVPAVEPVVDELPSPEPATASAPQPSRHALTGVERLLQQSRGAVVK